MKNNVRSIWTACVMMFVLMSSASAEIQVPGLVKRCDRPGHCHRGAYTTYSKAELDTLFHQAEARSEARSADIEKNVVASLARLTSETALADVLQQLSARISELEAAQQRIKQLEARLAVLESPPKQD
jgi:hypothetical protein